MGYALFTARKLSLTARLNACNAQLMLNADKANTITNSIFQQQSAINLQSSTQSQAAYQEYADIISSSQEQDDYDKVARTAKANLDAKLSSISLFTQMNDVQIQKLNQQQNLLDLERQRLETQLNAYQSELEKVEKAEETAIKNSAPKFGGS